MSTYEVDFNYKIEEFGSTVVEADDVEQAKDFALEYVRDTYDQVFGIEIADVREVKVPTAA